MSKPIDYSKWEHIDPSEDSSIDDGDDFHDDIHDNEESQQRKPTVTKLDHPSAVTIGPNGIQVRHPEKATISPFKAQHAPVATSDACAPSSLTRAQCNAKSEDEDGGDDLEDSMVLAKLTRNGQNLHNSGGYLWSQTRETVTFSILLPAMSVKGSHIKHFQVLKVDSDNISTDGSARLTFEIAHDGLLTKREFVFRYPIKFDEDRLDGCWQLHSLKYLNMRLMVVQLDKDSIGKGVYLWWDRALVGEAPVDTKTFADRQSEASAEKVQKIWEEAHKEFKARVQARK